MKDADQFALGWLDPEVVGGVGLGANICALKSAGPASTIFSIVE